MMKKILILSLCVMVFSVHACELNRPVRFAGNDWDSNSFSTEVARYIIEKAFQCKTQSIPGTSVPLLNALVRGDVDISMELWKANNTEIWNKMLKTGRVKETQGVSIDRATQHFFVPRFVVYGDKRRGIAPLAPKLRSVEDMRAYYALFRDPANPNKGRFYNCKIGWTCEVMNSKKLTAYHLSDDYVNFRTGSGEALRSEIISALKRKQAIFFYYWGPTYLIGKYGQELFILKEPAYNRNDWQRLSDSKTGKGVKGVAYPALTIHIAANVSFLSKAPQISAFLNRIYMNSDDINDGIVYMNDHQDLTGRKAAIVFLKQHPEVWTKWLPDKYAKQVQQALQDDKQSLAKQATPGLIKLTSVASIFLLILLTFCIFQHVQSVKKYWAVLFAMVMGLIAFYLYLSYASSIFFSVTPAHSLVPIRGFIDETINVLVADYADFLRRSISYPVLYVIGKIGRVLINQISWVFLTLIFTGLAYHASRKIGFTLFVLIGSCVMWGMQLWVPGIQTLVLVFMAILMTVVLGLPLGILMGLYTSFYRLISPVLDIMQTMPSFVYLIPVVMLFGLGTFSGVIATAIYALPPLIRLTALGIRQVDLELLEAAQSFGAHPYHILTKVQLPLALPSIMLGINQAIMMALAMVVIASMIGVRGLGQEVLVGLQQQDMGVGFTAGLAIVFLSVMLDRISQAYGQRLQLSYPLQGGGQ